MNGYDTGSIQNFERSGNARAGSFSRGRGGAGSNRGNGGNGSSVRNDFITSQGPSQSFQTSQGPSQSFQTSQGAPHQRFQTSQELPQSYQTLQGPPQSFQTSHGVPRQGYQTSQTGHSQGYSGQQGDVRPQSGFERSRGAMGSSFSRGQGAQGGRFASSRPVATETMGGGFQERVVHQMGGQGQQGLIGGPDSNEEWRKKQEEAIARNSTIIPQETPAKKPVAVKEVVNIDPDVQIQHVGGATGDPRLERIPIEPIRHPREVTPPPSQSRSSVPTQSIPLQNVPIHSVPLQNVPLHSVPTHSVPTQSVPVLSGAVSGLISSVANASSKSDMEQISEVVGLMAEAFRKLDIFMKSKK